MKSGPRQFQYGKAPRFTCEICGKRFARYGNRGRSRARFCSKQCKDAPRRRVDLQCLTCRRPFWRYESETKHRNAQFCSTKCAHMSRRILPTLICKFEQCQKPFMPPARTRMDTRGKFCSRDCYAEWTLWHRTRIYDCAECGALFRRGNATNAKTKGKKRFCSRECSTKHQRGEHHHASRSPRLPRRGRVWKELGLKVKERDGFACVRCGKPEGPAHRDRLQIDHVIPARSFDDPAVADRMDNLRSLCASCHATKTFGYEPRILRGDFLAIAEFYTPHPRLEAGAEGFAISRYEPPTS